MHHARASSEGRVDRLPLPLPLPLPLTGEGEKIYSPNMLHCDWFALVGCARKTRTQTNATKATRKTKQFLLYSTYVNTELTDHNIRKQYSSGVIFLSDDPICFEVKKCHPPRPPSYQNLPNRKYGGGGGGGGVKCRDGETPPPYVGDIAVWRSTKQTLRAGFSGDLA